MMHPVPWLHCSFQHRKPHLVLLESLESRRLVSPESQVQAGAEAATLWWLRFFWYKRERPMAKHTLSSHFVFRTGGFCRWDQLRWVCGLSVSSWKSSICSKLNARTPTTLKDCDIKSFPRGWNRWGAKPQLKPKRFARHFDRPNELVHGFSSLLVSVIFVWFPYTKGRCVLKWHTKWTFWRPCFFE